MVWPWAVAWAWVAVVNVGVAGGDHTTTPLPTSMMPTPAATPIACEDARIKCALRAGCGMALQNYMLGCADLISGGSAECDPFCRNTLIALTSTEEGHALMDVSVWVFPLVIGLFKCLPYIFILFSFPTIPSFPST